MIYQLITCDFRYNLHKVVGDYESKRHAERVGREGGYETYCVFDEYRTIFYYYNKDGPVDDKTSGSHKTRP